MKGTVLGFLAGLALLAGCTPAAQPAAAKIEAKPVWGNGDTASYTIQDPKGKELGTHEISISKDANGFAIHQLSQIGAYKDDLSIVVRADDLKPVSGHRVIDSQMVFLLN
ncbi:MAG: hypothetical protein M1401_14815 [Chloroflexi bacterium]|nr:hypothetical protein [Chloroflexota bacterium]MCL5110101.1 hypothetical protein [Chloroflexota bacterium]